MRVIGRVFCLASCLCGPLIAAAPSIRDDAASVPRLVSLSPHITELLFAAGAGARIVGVDDASDYPPAVRGIARLGEPASLDLERLIRLRPSRVILWETGSPPKLVAQLERLHMSTTVTEQRHLDDIGAAILEFGRIAGTEPSAIKAAREFREQLAALRAHYAHRRRLTVFFEVWNRPLYTLSADHVVNEVLDLCGGDNLFSDLSTLAPVVSREAVLARDPDVILIGGSGDAGDQDVAEWQRFPAMRAVSGRHIFLVNPSLIARMGPRILEGIEAVCTSLDRARSVAAVSH